MNATDTTEPSSTERDANTRAEKIADEVAEESRARMSNGNRQSQPAGKSGGAERGGPDLDKAEDREPPEAE